MLKGGGFMSIFDINSENYMRKISNPMQFAQDKYLEEIGNPLQAANDKRLAGMNNSIAYDRENNETQIEYRSYGSFLLLIITVGGVIYLIVKLFGVLVAFGQSFGL